MPITPDVWIADYHDRQARVRRGDTFIVIGLASFWFGFGISHFLARADTPVAPDSQCQPQTETGENK
jgi:hypothetical protein